MSKSKKNKKNNQSPKDTQTDQNSGDVLERVLSSIEMAGASLDFFEKAQVESTEEVLAIESTPAEVENLQADDETLIEEVQREVESASQQSGEAYDSDWAAFEASMAENQENHETPIEGDVIQVQAAQPDDGDDEMTQEEFESLEQNAELEFVDQTQAISIIESLLFSSDRPVGLGTFKQVFKGTNIQGKQIKKALEELQSIYAQAVRGVTLEEINGGWQLRTKMDNMEFLRRLAKVRPFKLSGPALEVLSIIAYKQPIVKSEVDEIRGVESGHLIRALMEKHLIAFQGKSELPGKPMQYGTTRKFLEIFGLRNLRELPTLDEIDQLLPEGIGEEEKDEKLSDVTARMAEDYQGNYSEGEDELLKIESTLDGIDTSSEFFEQEKQRQKEKRDRDRARDIREALDVGEFVDDKDQKWLIRYEQKLAAEAEAVRVQQDNADAHIEEALKEITEESTPLVEDQEMREMSAWSEDEVETSEDAAPRSPDVEI